MAKVGDPSSYGDPRVYVRQLIFGLMLEKGVHAALVKSAHRLCVQIWAAKGRTSVDRSSKAALLLTVPRGAFKSSAKDLPDRRLKLRLWAYAPGPKPIRSRVTTVRKMELHRALLLA